MADFREMVDWLKDMGFFDIVLPFLLVYAICYAVLEKSRIFYINKGGEEDKSLKNISMIVSFVFGLFAVASLQFISFAQNFIVYSSMVLIFFVGILIVLGLIFGDSWIMFFKKGEDWNMKVIYFFFGILAFFMIVFAFFSLGFDNNLSDFLEDRDFDISYNFFSIFIIVIIGLIIYMISKEDKKEGESE